MSEPPKCTEVDPFETEEYQRFVESMVPYCRCRMDLRPCDGVLAGGICDGITDEGINLIFDYEEDCDQ